MDPLAVFTLEQLKGWLKLPPAEATPQDETILIPLGNAVSAYVEERTGTKWKARDYTIVRDGDGRGLLLRLPRPIVAVTSLSIDGVALAASEYAVYAESGKIALRSRSLAPGLQNVVVELEAGYATVPADIVGAALDLAKAYYEEIANGAVSLSSVVVGPVTATLKPGINPRIERFLDAKRDVRG